MDSLHDGSGGDKSLENVVLKCSICHVVAHLVPVERGRAVECPNCQSLPFLVTMCLAPQARAAATCMASSKSAIGSSAA